MSSNMNNLYRDYIKQSKMAEEFYKQFREQKDKADAAKYAWLNGAAAASGDDSQPFGEEPGKQIAVLP